MTTKTLPRLEIIVPFHGENFSCIKNLQPPNDLSETIRTIFIYDGDLINNIALKKANDQLVNDNKILKNIKSNGAGGSRNLGLKEASAEYVIFADSDDYIDFKKLEHLLKNIDSSDITFCKSESKFNDLSGEQSARNISYNNAIDKYIRSRNKEDLKNIYVPWSKIFRREFLISHKINFNEVEASNDVMFSISALVASKKIATTSNSFYTVIDSKSSLTKKFTKSNVLSRFLELSKFNLFLRQNTNWKLHPMSAQIFLCFRVSFLLGIKALIKSIYNRFPLFYSFGHALNILKERGFTLLK